MEEGQMPAHGVEEFVYVIIKSEGPHILAVIKSEGPPYYCVKPVQNTTEL